MENIKLEDQLLKEEFDQEKEGLQSFSQEEVDRMLQARLSRQERKSQKEIDKYKNIYETLSHVTGIKEVEDLKGFLQKFYKDQGLNFPSSQNSLTERDEIILGRAYAEEIIASGMEEMMEVLDELSKKKELSVKEKTIKDIIGMRVAMNDGSKELSKLGVDISILEDEDFINFAKRCRTDMGLVDIYKFYKQVNKEEIAQVKPVGQLKEKSLNNKKDFYSKEEASRFTDADYKKNPKLIDLVMDSMTKWR